MSLPVAILAGGLATRLRPITETIPKGLIPVLGRPFLSHQIDLLKRHGLDHFVLCIGYLGEMIEREFGDGRQLGVKIEYSYDGPKLLGTGGALRQALPKLGGSFYVLYGDSYLEIDYQAIGKAFLDSGKRGLMTVFANEGQWDTSNACFQNGELLAYSKKSRTVEMKHIDYGLSVLHADVIQGLILQEPTDLADVFTRLVAERQMVGYEVFTRFFEVGSKSGIAEFEHFLTSKSQ